MSKWRSEAIKRMPVLRKKIAEAETVVEVWIDLFFAFEKAYEREPRDEQLIAAIYSYADWCINAPRNDDAGKDPFTAAVVSFYEDIPRYKPARNDMPRWFTYEEVATNKNVFSYHISDAEYLDLLHYMRKHQKRYVPRQKPA